MPLHGRRCTVPLAIGVKIRPVFLSGSSPLLYYFLNLLRDYKGENYAFLTSLVVCTYAIY